MLDRAQSSAPIVKDIIVRIARWLPPVGGAIVVLPTLYDLLLSPINPELGGFRLPALALELVSGEQQLRRVVAAYPSEAIGPALALDSWFFIPAYCVLFISVGITLIRLSKIRSLGANPADRYIFAIGVLLIACVAAAAVADVLENYYSSQAITVQTSRIADAILQAALVKWWLFVAITALLAAAFLRFGGWVLAVTLLYLAAAVVGAAGLLQYYPLVEWFFALLGLALIPTGAALLSIVRARTPLRSANTP